MYIYSAAATAIVTQITLSRLLDFSRPFADSWREVTKQRNSHNLAQLRNWSVEIFVGWCANRPVDTLNSANAYARPFHRIATVS